MSESVLHLIVQGTLVTLVAFSVATWALVLVKGVQAWRARRENGRFIKDKGPDGVPALELLARHNGPQARVTQTAIGAWQENQALVEDHPDAAREVLEIRLKQQIQRERRTSENGLAILASIGTTSPFVGLFGTVWGIMGALSQIGSTGSAGLEVVAGPIGEALIATGVGIAVAVPAVLAFNVFVRRLKVQSADLEELANSLVVLGLQNKLGSARSSSGDLLGVSGTVLRRADIRVPAIHHEASA